MIQDALVESVAARLRKGDMIHVLTERYADRGNIGVAVMRVTPWGGVGATVEVSSDIMGRGALAEMAGRVASRLDYALRIEEEKLKPEGLKVREAVEAARARADTGCVASAAEASLRFQGPHGSVAPQAPCDDPGTISRGADSDAG